MTTKKRVKHRESATVYVIAVKGGYHCGFGAGYGPGTLAMARVYTERPKCNPGERAVPCRLTVLPSAKKNRTRTR